MKEEELQYRAEKVAAAIEELIEECLAEKAVIKIKRDGSLSFEIIAGKEKEVKYIN